MRRYAVTDNLNIQTAGRAARTVAGRLLIEKLAHFAPK